MIKQCFSAAALAAVLAQSGMAYANVTETRSDNWAFVDGECWGGRDGFCTPARWYFDAPNGEPTTGSVDLVGDAPFNIESFRAYSLPGFYFEVQGKLGSEVVYSYQETYGTTFGEWRTVANPYANVAIDSAHIIFGTPQVLYSCEGVCQYVFAYAYSAISWAPAPVPEPGSLALLMAGIATSVACRKRSAKLN